MYNKQKIFTLALNRLGIAEPIDLSSNDVKIAVLNNEYETAVQNLLSEVDWNFAKTERELTLCYTKNKQGILKYYFDIPNDCVRPRVLTSVLTGKKLLFETFGKHIITDCEAVNLSYTTKKLDENDFSSDFVRTLSYSLAASVALTLTESENKFKMMNAIYNDCVLKYAAMNANDGNEVLPELEYYEVR